jgi:hypothetical protein
MNLHNPPSRPKSLISIQSIIILPDRFASGEASFPSNGYQRYGITLRTGKIPRCSTITLNVTKCYP